MLQSTRAIERPPPPPPRETHISRHARGVDDGSADDYDDDDFARNIKEQCARRPCQISHSIVCAFSRAGQCSASYVYWRSVCAPLSLSRRIFSYVKVTDASSRADLYTRPQKLCRCQFISPRWIRENDCTRNFERYFIYSLSSSSRGCAKVFLYDIAVGFK